MVTVFTNICTDRKTTLEHCTNDIISRLNDKLHEAETKVTEGHHTSWSDLSSKTSKTHVQFIKADSITVL